LFKDPLNIWAHHSFTPPWGSGTRTNSIEVVELEMTTSRIAASAFSWIEALSMESWDCELSLEEDEKVFSSMFKYRPSSAASELPEILARTYKSRNVKESTDFSSLVREACSSGFGETLLIGTSSPQFRPCRSNFYNKACPLSNGCEQLVGPLISIFGRLASDKPQSVSEKLKSHATIKFSDCRANLGGTPIDGQID
jgi:hypothetical protein